MCRQEVYVYISVYIYILYLCVYFLCDDVLEVGGGIEEVNFSMTCKSCEEVLVFLVFVMRLSYAENRS